MSYLTPEAALTAAVKKAGSFSALARLLGITPQAVQQWRVVPPNKVLQVSQHCGISCHELRPDIFGQASAQATSSQPVADCAAGSVLPGAEPAVAEGC